MTTTRITTVRWRPFRLPMRHRFEAASGMLEDRAGVLVQFVDSEGRTATGEASPMPSLGAGTVADVLALLEQHGAALADPASAEALGDGPGAMALRCALDVASLDLDAQAASRPLAALLSEAHAPWVAVNAVIGGGPAHEVARFGQEALAGGYSVVKMKVGVESLDSDLRRVAALRDACPEATVRLDANGAWDEDTANRAIEALYPLRIELLEQPTPAADVEMLARVREHASLRVAADEPLYDPALRDQVIERRAADFLVLKPMLLGGLRPAMALARRGAEMGINAFVTTTFDSSVGTAASLHVAAALPSDAAHGLATSEHLAADVTVQTLLPRAGRMALPASAGLGVTPDEAALAAVATAGWSEAKV
ncbi:MAG: hypothetical protein GEV08_25370 [Acidimicrobiia bacterium]|nr:hypothetical protein [Acidimicrobiia bacterium]MPZ99364.1 hypothetical protein [Dehalococcoidia bacterium]